MIDLFWTTSKRIVRSLTAFSQNPRFLTREQAKQLRASIEKFGFVEIPVIDLDGTILAGHQRISMLMSMGRGDEEIDVRVPNRKLTPDEFKEYNLRSNLNTGSWDYDILATGDWENDKLIEFGFTEEMLGLKVSDEVVEETKEHSIKYHVCPACNHKFTEEEN